jgi:hypothetical protein
MRAPQFMKWFAKLPALNVPQRLKTLTALQPAAGLDRQALLVSDAHGAYRNFARKHGIAHEFVNLRSGVRVRRGAAAIIHVQNVNSYHQRFRQWLSRFRGVASRYLPNYLGWRRALDGNRVRSAEELLNIAIRIRP